MNEQDATEDAENIEDAGRLFALMEAASETLGKVWEHLDPRKTEEGGGNPSSGLAGAETLANFFGAATLLFHAMHAVHDEVDRALGDDGDDEELGPEDATSRLQADLERTGIVVTREAILSWTKEQRIAAEFYTTRFLGFGATVPRPDFLK